MQPFAVIFDFNGTMLFDTPLQYQAWNMIAEQTIGKSIGIDTFLRTANGRSSAETVDIFWGKSLTKDEKQALISNKRQNKIYNKKIWLIKSWKIINKTDLKNDKKRSTTSSYHLTQGARRITK